MQLYPIASRGSVSADTVSQNETKARFSRGSVPAVVGLSSPEPEA